MALQPIGGSIETELEGQLQSDFERLLSQPTRIRVVEIEEGAVNEFEQLILRGSDGRKVASTVGTLERVGGKLKWAGKWLVVPAVALAAAAATETALAPDKTEETQKRDDEKQVLKVSDAVSCVEQWVSLGSMLKHIAGNMLAKIVYPSLYGEPPDKNLSVGGSTADCIRNHALSQKNERLTITGLQTIKRRRAGTGFK